jgi:hypothetical protein
MAVGDWSDSTDFWTGTPPILISAIKCNTMFLNTYRLLAGCERFHEIERKRADCECSYINTVAGEAFYYSVRITDDCPWDALTIIEKVLATSDNGFAQLINLTVTHVGAEVMLSTTKACADYSSWTWVTLVSNYDITGWAAGNHLIEVIWQPPDHPNCRTLHIKCRHAMLRTTV